MRQGAPFLWRGYRQPRIAEIPTPKGWHTPCTERKGKHTPTFWRGAESRRTCALHVRAEPAVYAVYRDGVLVYIGASMNVRRRLSRGHAIILRLLAEKRAVAIKVRYVRSFRLALTEKRLIARLAPECNLQSVGRGWHTDRRRIIRQEFCVDGLPAIDWPEQPKTILPNPEHVQTCSSALQALIDEGLKTTGDRLENECPRCGDLALDYKGDALCHACKVEVRDYERRRRTRAW